MEDFRKTVKKRLKVYTFICCIGSALYFTLVLLTKNSPEMAQALTLGIFSGLEVVAAFNLVKDFSALHNEEKLKEMYIRETDERNAAIQKETSRKCFAVTMLTISAAAITAGFFDEKVCIVLVAVMVYCSVVYITLSAYYNKRM